MDIGIKLNKNFTTQFNKLMNEYGEEMARLNSLPDTINKNQLLFGINQGGVYEDIRIRHAQEISKMDLDGYEVLLSNYSEHNIENGKITLKPYEAVMLYHK